MDTRGGSGQLDVPTNGVFSFGSGHFPADMASIQLQRFRCGTGSRVDGHGREPLPSKLSDKLWSSRLQ